MTKETKIDLGHAAVSVLLAACGVGSMFAASRCFAVFAIIGTNGYLIAALIVAAVYSVPPKQGAHASEIGWLLPRRLPAFLFIYLFLIAVVSGFAGLYVGTALFKGRIPDISEALYISFLTLGFSDFEPTSTPGRWIVMWELFSGVLLLMGAFPFLVSRISTLPEK